MIFLLLLFDFSHAERPNILFILADDLGWGDVSWNNDLVKSTPFLANMAKDGAVLKQSYSAHRCTPTRASLLTGRYAFRFGLGADAISKENPVGMDLGEKLLPAYLKEVGYETHLVGKWHLGHCNSSFHPHNRGFDSFYGHYGGSMDYFEHTKVIIL